MLAKTAYLDSLLKPSNTFNLEFNEINLTLNLTVTTEDSTSIKTSYNTFANSGKSLNESLTTLDKKYVRGTPIDIVAQDDYIRTWKLSVVAYGIPEVSPPKPSSSTQWPVDYITAQSLIETKLNHDPRMLFLRGVKRLGSWSQKRSSPRPLMMTFHDTFIDKFAIVGYFLETQLNLAAQGIWINDGLSAETRELCSIRYNELQRRHIARILPCFHLPAVWFQDHNNFQDNAEKCENVNPSIMQLKLTNLPDEMLVKILSIVPDNRGKGLVLPSVLRRVHFYPRIIVEVIKFFNWLEKCLPICDAPMYISVIETLSIDFDFTDEFNDVTNIDFSKFRKLIRQATQLQDLRLRFGNFVLDITDISWVNCPNLTSLTMQHHGTFQTSFYSTLSRPNILPKLKHLNISVTTEDRSVSEHWYLMGLGEGVRQLESLRLYDRHISCSRFAQYVLPHLWNLKTLKLIVGADANTVIVSICNAIARHCGTLKELELNQSLNDLCVKQFCAESSDTQSFRDSIEIMRITNASLTHEIYPLMERLTNLKRFANKLIPVT